MDFRLPNLEAETQHLRDEDFGTCPALSTSTENDAVSGVKQFLSSSKPKLRRGENGNESGVDLKFYFRKDFC